MTKDKQAQITVQLPDRDALSAIHEAAQREGVTAGQWVRNQIEEGLRQRGTEISLQMMHGGRRPYGLLPPDVD